MSQHWDPCQQNKPCFYVFLLVQFIANGALFLFPLPFFPPYPLLPPCCLVLFVWKKTSSRPCQVWHQLILIWWCPAESSSDKHLLSVRSPRLLATLCFHCCLFSDTLWLLTHWNPPHRVFHLQPEPGSEQDIPPRLPGSSHRSLLSGTTVCLSLYEQQKADTVEEPNPWKTLVQKAMQECRPVKFWPLFFSFLYRTFLCPSLGCCEVCKEAQLINRLMSSALHGQQLSPLRLCNICSHLAPTLSVLLGWSSSDKAPHMFSSSPLPLFPSSPHKPSSFQSKGKQMILF